MRTALRLEPGDDLRLRLQALTLERAWPGAFVVCGIGSLRVALLRMAGADEPRVVEGPLELIGLCGSLCADGAHLHASVADAEGRVTGGHVCAGCIVLTTAELLLEVMEAERFERAFDAATGYAELRIGPS